MTSYDIHRVYTSSPLSALLSPDVEFVIAFYKNAVFLTYTINYVFPSLGNIYDIDGTGYLKQRGLKSISCKSRYSSFKINNARSLILICFFCLRSYVTENTVSVTNTNPGEIS